MPFTPAYAIPYQTLADPPDGPNLGEDGFLIIDSALAAIEARLAAMESNGLRNATTALVATAETTASTSFADLATPGPAVTVTTDTTALVVVSAFLFNGTSGFVSYMGYAVSGATTVAASDDRALLLHSQIVFGQGRLSMAHLQTGLTPGSNTFTSKYRVNGGTGSWSNRSIIVIPC